MEAAQQATRKALERRAHAAVTFCDELLDRLHREDGSVAGSTSSHRVYKLVSFMVKYILSQPVLREEFKRLANLDLRQADADKAQKLRAEIEGLLGRVLAPVGANVTPSAVVVHGVTYPFSNDPLARLSQYGDELTIRASEAISCAPLKDRGSLEDSRQQCDGKVRELQRLMGYEVDYEGGESARLLLKMHMALCPDEAQQVRDVARWRLSSVIDQEIGVTDGPPIESIRSAVRDVHAALDVVLDELRTRTALVDRLAAFFQLYSRERVMADVRSLRRKGQRSLRIEEHVFRPLVAEYLFNQGYYPISESQLGRGGSRVDILAQASEAAPDVDAWFLYELKQSGFVGGRPPTRGDIERKLHGAVVQATRYRDGLATLRGIRPDVYVICFVKGNARFEDGDDPESSYWHHVVNKGIGFHLRLVNLWSPGHKSPALPVRAAKLGAMRDTSHITERCQGATGRSIAGV